MVIFVSDAVELHLRPHCVLNTRVRAQRGAAARWAALSAESTKPAGATAGSISKIAPDQSILKVQNWGRIRKRQIIVPLLYFPKNI